MSKTPRTDEHLRMKEENGHAVIVSGDFARQLETELAEALAEIKNWKIEADEAADRAVRMCNASTALVESYEQRLAEARAEIERLKDEHENSLDRAKNYTLKLSDTVTKQAGELFAKSKLIEQMREALKACAEFIHYYDQEHNIGDGKVLEQATAALSAAERVSHES